MEFDIFLTKSFRTLTLKSLDCCQKEVETGFFLI